MITIESLVEQGANVKLENQEWKTFLDSRHQGTFDVARAGWCADYNEPTSFLNTMLSDSSNNTAHYKSPAFDKLIGDTLNKVSEGHALSEQTRLAMDSIILHIDNISQLVTEINHASREQSAGIGQVNLAMTHIGEASHINADRISRSEQTAQTLREKGSHLTQLVSLFQLKG